ncbi:50S ribosomal protein L18 [Candidatus Babeliales bacterium]|nr:50S ribosomal protein L18 [Candidatus Babeliales bacterium]
MSLKKINQKRSQRRAQRVRHKIRKHSSLPRVSVFRSRQEIYAQLIDDAQGKTLASASSLKLDKASAGDKTAQAKAVGLALAEGAKAQKIEKICFERGAYRYHGRVKALAEGLREGGLSV